MYIEITTGIGCKNNCSFCPQATIVKNYLQHGGDLHQTFNLETYKKYINKIPNDVYITFCGMSEPWLNPQCTKMVEYTVKKGHVVYVYTTLVGMKPNDIKILEKLSFEDNGHGFIVHLPSADNLEHITIDAIYLKVLTLIVSSQIPAQFHYHGSDLHPAVRDIMSKHKDKLFQILPHSRAGNLDDAQHIKRRSGSIGCRKMRDLGCYGFILLPNGLMLLCCQDYGMKHILGDLSRQSFEEICHSSELKFIEKGLRDEKLDILCRYCEHTYNINWKAKLKNKNIVLHEHIS